MDRLGFDKIEVISTFGSMEARLKIQGTSFGECLRPNHYLRKWLDAQINDGIMFVQGDRFYENLADTIWDDITEIKLIYGCSDPILFRSDSQRLSHINCGGITDGEWPFLSTNVGVTIPSHRGYFICIGR